MFIEPNDPPVDTPSEDDTDPLAAMDRGIEAVSEAAPAEPVEPAAPQAVEGEPPPAEVVEPAADPAAVAADQKPADEAKPAEAKDDAPAPDADTEKEIGDLKLKDRAAERFRDLSTEVRTAAPVMAALKEAGIPAEQLPSALQAASNHREWVQQVVDTGASPEEYADSLSLLSLVSSARKGDHASAEAALQALAPIVADIAKLTGRKVPGVHDPLDAHADLREAIESGEMTEKHALEVARARQLAVNTQAQNSQRELADKATRDAQAGVNALIAIDAEFKTNDPDYARKRPILNGIVQSIRATLPPEQWAGATRRAYATIPAMPAPAPVPQAPPAGHVPLRPTGSRAVNLQPEYDDPMAAMEAGLAAVATR